MGWLFDTVAPLFNGDDYVSWVTVTFPERDAIVSAYHWLRSEAAGLVNQDTSLWLRTEERDAHVDSVPNPSRLVVDGEADSFCVWLRGLMVDGVTLPELGIFVMPSEVEINWHGGAAWREAEVDSFFALLYRMMLIAPGTQVAMPEGVDGVCRERFMTAWQRFLQERNA